jgi:protein SCO1/2
LVAVTLATSVRAHHPGADLDELLGSNEQYFEAIDRPSPAFELSDAEGHVVTLAGHDGKVVVLHFIYASCPDVCPLHAEKLADVQAMINQTPMKDMVQFISVTTDPRNDTKDALKDYGPARGLDPINWTFLTTLPSQDETATRALAKEFGHSFTPTADGYQVHGVVTHIIDRRGRWAANFHGLRFDSLNMVHYINGLTNDERLPVKDGKDGWWTWFLELFE